MLDRVVGQPADLGGKSEYGKRVQHFQLRIVDCEYLCRGVTGQPPDEIIKNLNNKEPVGPRH